jgi:hypothetical protein
MRNRVTGLTFVQEATINTNTYLGMVQIYTVHQIDNLTTTHHSVTRRRSTSLEFTSTGVPGREISWKMDQQRRPIVLPHRSPDFTPLDAFMLGYINSIVYQSPFVGIDDQKKCITDTIMAIHADVHLRTLQDLEYWLDVVRSTEGALTAVH